ncbi:MAG: T9SS C-terminal target domain-containing protein [Calditrichaeota bacterium]|nr:MAG: T9SS C-terminal target domain-containing protein [Calditrichota bacterium]MBL1204543.1 T9SS C-terminal target domain-containing protein [Calditrichota bacterium]NOG44371.1 T9SS type A sorting domain-containing protein [Calditrichota bacterium]
MKKTIWLILFCVMVLFGQTISVNKDSVFLGGLNTDSLLIYNSGDTLLRIDSIISKYDDFGYNLEITTADSSFGRYISNYENETAFSIAKHDTAILDFIWVDLCTICKVSSNFTDSLIFYNNSNNNKALSIFTSGYGFSDLKNNDFNSLPSFVLFENYPNPFNPTTIINYELRIRSDVKITVYDIAGREIETLVNKSQTSGIHSVAFNAQNLASGVYYYRIKAGDFVQTKKMVLLR